MGEGTRVVEYADNRRVDELVLIIARLEGRIARLEKAQQNSIFGMPVVVDSAFSGALVYNPHTGKYEGVITNIDKETNE